MEPNKFAILKVSSFKESGGFECLVQALISVKYFVRISNLSLALGQWKTRSTLCCSSSFLYKKINENCQRLLVDDLLNCCYSLLQVKDVMKKQEELPVCKEGDLIMDQLVGLTTGGCGCLLVIDDNYHLIGTFTDGDLRRTLKSSGEGIFKLTVGEMCNR